ncbi:hypothetical protein [Dissulfurimicrobium hydrothermale]|uniref:hypothetical protein n=1 Tax=Dissulfurimicrobium hydrothermale TaxID=1750598 RepID=UPI001EDBDD29|nr:hypothetical protein [Dissulfurimicrobium hydrothermale]UKL13639.1 hypothetical protein LGS26_09275 [Dissulfurimicrobium hydrothermale]
MGVGLRLRSPNTPREYRIKVLIMPDVMPKMIRLLNIVGGKVIKEHHGHGFIELIIEKR